MEYLKTPNEHPDPKAQPKRVVYLVLPYYNGADDFKKKITDLVRTWSSRPKNAKTQKRENDFSRSSTSQRENDYCVSRSELHDAKNLCLSYKIS